MHARGAAGGRGQAGSQVLPRTAVKLNKYIKFNKCIKFTSTYYDRFELDLYICTMQANYMSPFTQITQQSSFAGSQRGNNNGGNGGILSVTL
jgi:hypothetical protein